MHADVRGRVAEEFDSEPWHKIQLGRESGVGGRKQKGPKINLIEKNETKEESKEFSEQFSPLIDKPTPPPPSISRQHPSNIKPVTAKTFHRVGARRVMIVITAKACKLCESSTQSQ